MMNLDECNAEILECARYGEEDDLETLLKVEGVNVDHKGGGGNTALHRASANGEVGCMSILKRYGASHVVNDTGNLPLHWAVQNRQLEAVRFLVENYECDMLDKNGLGKSVVTEAFSAANQDILELVLSHKTSTEERLIPEGGKLNVEGEEGEGEGDGGEASDPADKHAVLHDMYFLDEREGARREEALRVRELPITRADNPFGTHARPEDDTTGLAIWPASILLARWLESKTDLLRGKVVVELGAGCGLPALAAALYCGPRAVYVTDIHRPTLENAVHNVQLNQSVASAEMEAGAEKAPMTSPHDLIATTYRPEEGSEVRIVVRNVDWTDPASFPPEPAEVVVGSDLVYDKDILDVLLPALDTMLLAGGSFLYVAPDTGRAGMPFLVDALQARGYSVAERFSCPSNMYRSPLKDIDMCVLNFYDLTAKAPHTCFHFKRQA